jgi:hypothetical protein
MERSRLRQGQNCLRFKHFLPSSADSSKIAIAESTFSPKNGMIHLRRIRGLTRILPMGRQIVLPLFPQQAKTNWAPRQQAGRTNAGAEPKTAHSTNG